MALLASGVSPILSDRNRVRDSRPRGGSGVVGLAGRLFPELTQLLQGLYDVGHRLHPVGGVSAPAADLHGDVTVVGVERLEGVLVRDVVAAVEDRVTADLSAERGDRRALVGVRDGQ